MATLKIIVLAAIFIITSGSFFSEYFRKHKSLVVLSIIVSIVGSFYLVRSIYDDFVQSRNSDDETSTAGDVLTTSAGHIKDIKIGMPKEAITNYFGPPNYRDKFGENIAESYLIDDYFIKLLIDDLDTVSGFCVTVLKYGKTYAVKHRMLGLDFIIGKDKYDLLPAYDVPVDATWDFGNWSGFYRYEETGFAPTVAGGGFDGYFGFHGIQDYFGKETLWKAYVPHYYDPYGKPALGLRIIDSLDENRPTLQSTKQNSDRYGRPYFEPKTFQETYEKFRKTYGPDTYCVGVEESFRNVNYDLEKIEPDFRYFLKAQ